MRPFSYLAPRTAEEAVAAFVRAGAGATYIAGGTSLYDLMKLGVAHPRQLIDLTRIDGLDRIDTGGRQLRFGALAPMSAVAADPVIVRDYPVLAESLDKAASQQLRNMATVGGNLLQRTRCPYFRNGAGGPSMAGGYPCNKRAPGSGCAAIEGLDRGQAVLGQSDACTATSPGDWPIALVALDASLELMGPAGRRSLPLTALYRLPGTTPHLEFALEAGELITAIVVPKTRAGRRSTYHKVRDRESYAFALASAAVALDMSEDGGRVRRARIALGGVATTPWRATVAERMLVGQRIDVDTGMAAGVAALRGAQAGRSNTYKIELAARTVAAALMIAAGRTDR